MRIADLARLLEISHGRLSNWERGEHDPPTAIVMEAAKHLRVSTRFLLTGTRDPSTVAETSRPLYPVSFQLVELPYGGYVPAGTWRDPFETEELIELEAKFDAPGRFACRIEGDSMYPLLQPEDVAIFQAYKTRRPPIGHIILARREDQSVTVKLLEHDGENFRLKAINPRHDEAVAPKWDAVGFLVGIERKRGSHQRSDYDPDGIRVTDANSFL